MDVWRHLREVFPTAGMSVESAMIVGLLWESGSAIPGDPVSTAAALRRLVGSQELQEAFRKRFPDDEFPRGLTRMVRWIVQSFAIDGFAGQSEEGWQFAMDFLQYYGHYGEISDAPLLDPDFAGQILAALNACTARGLAFTTESGRRMIRMLSRDI